MTFSSIDLCSQALIKIGAEPISSFDDGTVEARVAAGLYPMVRDALLSFHPWNFALAQVRPPRLVDPPVADYPYAYALPTDCLRVLSVGSGGAGQGVAYRVRGRIVATAAEDIVITYIATAAEAAFPPYFTLAMVARLAAEFCIPLTDSTSRWKALSDLAEIELRRARLFDAQEDTAPAFERFPLIEERR